MIDPRATHEDPATELCREALRVLDAAMDKPPTELNAEADTAEREIAALRDLLIERTRQRTLAASSAALEQVNVALSLVVGLEYPVGGIQRELLDQARTVLRGVLGSGLD
jgi:tagatose-1,6-bisphosphate aldolase non-catalytic subunit AgaZ/GatZ